MAERKAERKTGGVREWMAIMAGSERMGEEIRNRGTRQAAEPGQSEGA